MSLTGFKDGNTFVNLNFVECITIEHNSHHGEWSIVVYLRYETDDRTSYTMYESKNESEAKEHFDSLIDQFSNVRI